MGDVITLRIWKRKTSKNWIEKRDRYMVRQHVIIKIIMNISKVISPMLFN